MYNEMLLASQRQTDKNQMGPQRTLMGPVSRKHTTYSFFHTSITIINITNILNVWTLILLMDYIQVA